MSLPNDVLEKVAADIEKADGVLAELKDVVSDMKLSGMDTTEQDAEVKRLSSNLRSLKTFYERQKAKQTSTPRSKTTG